MSNNVIYINADNFNEVVSNDKLVVIDFYADWCGPCKMLAPVIDKLADEYQDKAVIAKCNVDDNNDIASQFQVVSIPTIFFIKDKKIVDKMVGLANPNAIKNIIDKNL